MKLKQAVIGKIEKTALGRRLLSDRHYRVIFFAVCGFIFNMLFSFYNGALGISNGAVLFKASAVYYFLLTLIQFLAVLENRRHSEQRIKKEYGFMIFSGVILCILALVHISIIYISMAEKTAIKYGEIVMITIAMYTFIKITLAVRKAVKYRKKNTPLISVIQNISYVQVAVAVLTMQQSMLVSFAKDETEDFVILNALTGAGVSVFVVALGISMIIKGRKPTNIKNQQTFSR